MKKERSFSIRVFLTILFVLSIVLSVSLVATTFTVPMARRTRTYIERDDLLLTSQLSESARYVVDTADNISASIAFDSDIQSLLVGYTYLDSSEPIESLRVKMNNALSLKGMFNRTFLQCANIVVFSNDGTVLGSKEQFDQNTDMLSFSWAEDVSKSRGNTFWQQIGSDERGLSTRNGLFIPVVRRIFSVPSSKSSFEEGMTVGLPIGYLLIYFDKDIFSEILSEYTLNSKRVFIVDGKGIICGSDDESLIGSRFKAEARSRGYVEAFEKTYLMTEVEIDGMEGWRCITLTDRSEVERDKTTIAILSLTLAVFLIAVFVAIGFLLSRLFSGPIGLLNTSFEKAERGKIRIDEKSRIKEFNQLYASFNATVEKVYRLADEVYLQQLERKELELSVKESQIQSLQNQINPHFLYNTLDSINWQAQMNGDYATAEMICTLGKFFRSNIRISENEIPVEMELENARLYIELSKYRFGDKISYSVDCCEALMKRPILRLLLQPLLENSIKHSLEVDGNPIHLSVSIKDDGERLSVVVSDNGKGMDRETLDYLSSLWKESGGESHRETRSIGLYNVYRRLRLTYYSDVSLEIWSRKGQGTRFSIEIGNNRKKS